MVVNLDVDRSTVGEFETWDINSMLNETDYSYAKVPIHVLIKSRIELNKKLLSKKLLQSPGLLSRDYRGLAELMGVTDFVPRGNDWIVDLFNEWSNAKPQSECNVAKFLDYLELIDRYDVYYDIISLVKEDCRRFFDTPVVIPGTERGLPVERALTLEDCQSLQAGAGLTQYDVILLYDEADSTVAESIYDRLRHEYKLSVCNMDDSFIATGQLHYEQFEKVIERCRNTVVFLSDSIQNNPLLTYLVKYSKAISIGNPNSKIIPVLLQETYSSAFDSSIEKYTKIKYGLHKGRGTMHLFWHQLLGSDQVSYTFTLILLT
ncbi:hypothetical protein WDU94_014160 [Cyamophila willieti]